MSKLIGVWLGLALSVTAVYAQEAPQPAPVPAPQPQEAPPKPKGAEKANTDENLVQNGQGGDRPWAKGVSADKQKSALVKFREGNELLNQGLFVRAGEKYREALKFWQHPAIHYNLALALMQSDQPIEAYESLEKSIVYGPAPLESDKYEHAKEYMLLLEKQIASVEVSCDKPGAKVSVDGKEVFVAPGTFKTRVRIGKHTFVAEKQGYTTRINAPFIGPNEKFRIELKLYTSEELTRYNRRWDKTWMPYAVIGFGVAAGVAGVVFELGATSKYNDYDKAVAACNQSNAGCPTDAALKGKRKSGDTFKTLGYVSYGVAGAAAATGLVLAILNRPKAYQIRPEDLQEEQGERISIKPVISPNLAGAMVQGHF
jgi:tetratricopeptide (TPR) repeat protein